MSVNAISPAVPRLLLTPEEAAEALQITRTRVYDLLRNGALPSIKLGRVRRISVAELERYIARLHEDAGA